MIGLLPAKICLLLAAGQVLCWLLARGLGARLAPRAVALGLGLPLVFLSPFLFDSDNLLAPTATLRETVPAFALPPVRISHMILGDPLYQFVPWELEVRHALRAGRLPLWSDLLDGGSSPWVNPQAGVLSPLAMLARALPVQDLLLALLALKMLVAAEGTWLLARRLGLSQAAAALAAAGFTLGGGMMGWALFPHSTTIAWVPWLCLGCIAVVRRPRLRAIAATALATGAMLLSGHPETAAAGGLLAAACGVALHRRRTGLLRGLAAAGAAAVLGFGLAAPQLLPFLHALPLAQRTADMLTLPPPSPPGFRLLDPSSWFGITSRRFILAALSPEAFGAPYDEAAAGANDWPDLLGGYPGLVALAGSAIALASWRTLRRRRAALPWLGFAAVAVLLAAELAPFGLLRAHLAVLRLPALARLLPVACLALAVGGGFGIDRLLGRSGKSREGPDRRPLPSPGVLVGLGVAAAASLAVAHPPHVLLLWGILLGAAFLAPWRRPVALAALALALALDLVPWGQRQLPRGQAALFYPANNLTRLVARETGGGGGGLVGSVPAAGGAAARAVGIQRLLYPGLLAVYGIADVRVNNVMAPASYQRVLRDAFHFDPTVTHYYSDFDVPDHPLLSFLGVRVVVGDLYLPPPRTLVPVPAPHLLPFQVFRNPRALPRWFVPAGIEVIDRQDLDGWIVHLADPGRVALFADEAARLPLAAAVSRTEARIAAAAPLAVSPGYALLTVPGDGPRLLATSFPGPGGWQARAVGAQEAGLDTLTVNGAFLGVLVPAGVTQIALRYRPPGLLTGALLGLLALAGTLACAVADRRPNRSAARRGRGGRVRRPR